MVKKYKRNSNNKIERSCPKCGKILEHKDASSYSRAKSAGTMCRECELEFGYIRNCPECGKEIRYNSSLTKNRSENSGKKCRDCMKEKFANLRKDYYLKNKERQSERQKEIYENCGGRERAKQYHINNKERRSEYMREWRSNNKEHIREYARSEKGRAISRNYDHKRRLIEINGCVSNEFIFNLLINTRFCKICKFEMNVIQYHPLSKHIDHIIPLAVGGKHSEENLRIICQTCNVRRPRDGRDLIPEIVLKFISLINKRIKDGNDEIY